MREKLIVAVVSALVGSLITLGGMWGIRSMERNVPVLEKDVYRFDISRLSPEFQRRVTALPVKYTLRHKAGGTAKNVTIFLNSNSAVTPSELIFDKWCEYYKSVQVDSNSIRIDIPSVRPSGIVMFEILTEAKNEIQFRERVEEGRIFNIE